MALKIKGRNAPRKHKPTFEERATAQMREPDGPSDFDLFKDELADDEKPFATMLWQMSCSHADEEKIVNAAENGEPFFLHCNRCSATRRWHGTKTETKLQEFAWYCPDGYDMFDWLDLYTRDRSMWRWIFMEVQAEMVEESIGNANEH